MKSLAFKKYLELPKPSEDDIRADRERIQDALKEEGIAPVVFSLKALRSLYPVAADAEYRITATLSPAENGMEVIRIEAGDTSDKCYGMALDIGSTTLELQLIDLISGEVCAAAGCVNSQTEFGLNILDRILAVRENRENLEKLRRLVINDISGLIADTLGSAKLCADDIACLTVGGNTTMIHMFVGCDPWQVFMTPYTPAFYSPEIRSAKELDLPLCCNVMCIPAVANYLGGDITSGYLLTGIDESEEIRLLMDIGTNGELILGNREFLLLGAGAAGPALEGFGSKFGMRAGPGVISGVRINERGEFELTVIGNTEPIGICGGGIFDLVAECFLAGWISSSGTVNQSASPHCITVEDKENHRVLPAIEYFSSGDKVMYFTEEDILEFLKCKAAAFTMVATMLDHCGIDLKDLDRIYLSGGFGTHLNIESAITVGIYPDIPRDKFTILGNSSLKGAKALLLNRELMKEVRHFTERATYLQFGEMERFLENMIAATFIPHTDINLYPSVRERQEQKKAQLQK